MRKQILLISILFFSLFLIGSIQAVTIEPISPEALPNISIGCGEIEIIHLRLKLDNYETVSVDFSMPYSLSGLYTGFDSTYFTNPYNGENYRQLYITYFTQSNCMTGTQTRILEFTSNKTNETYPITVTIKEDLYPLNDGHPFALAEGEKFSIGNTIHFNLREVDSNFVKYSLEGCGSSDELKLYEGDILEKICGTERLKVEIFEILGVDSAQFNISFSTKALTLTKSGSDNGESSSECELGLDTLGAKVKRGNIFAIKTINANTGKFEPQVSVLILDQQGELSPIAGISSYIGFFSERLHEEYLQDLIVQLEKEGCEPSTQIILFETSYDDYKLSKQQEEGATNLVLNMSARYEMKAISGTIKNLLNEVIDGVEVKITNPDETIIIVQTNVNGLFTWTPTLVGVYKLQGGKDNYQSTDLVSIEVYQNKEYLIVIKVNGEQKADYKKNDRITFELRDMNNTLIPLTIDATFAGLPLKFISGISDEVIFEDTATLVIPAIESYIEQSLQLTAKKTNWSGVLVTIGIIVGIIIVLILVVAIVKKFKGKEKPEQKMEIQLGGVE